MAKTPHILLPSLLLAASLLHGSLAVKFHVKNRAAASPGGVRFEAEIGVEYTVTTMAAVADFVWVVFQQTTEAERKQVTAVTIYIADLAENVKAQTVKDEIYINAKAIEGFAAGKAMFMFTALLYHEATHIFQWSGQGTAPAGLTEGIADYVLMKSEFFVAEGFAKAGAGSRWDEGYGVTARFLEYCESLEQGFVVALNSKMKVEYKEEYFQELLGKAVGEVWIEYKAKYKS